MSDEIVSVIVPVYNAAATVGRCLTSILEQDYPPEKVEIIVVDGMSTDSTAAVVRNFVRDHPRIKIFSNPLRRVPPALNIGIRESKGEVIVFVGGRGGVLAPDFVSKCVENLRKVKEAAVVGGVLEVGYDSFMGKAIGLALSCPFGVSTARYRYASEPRFVDTVGYGAYRREIFDEVGFTDENMCHAVDDEFNWRIVNAGYKIFMNPEIKYLYYGRESVPGLFVQYFGYGRGRAMAVRKHPSRLRIKHLIPPVFALFLPVGLVLSLLVRGLWIPYVSVLGSYAVLSLFASARIAAREGWKLMLVLPAIFFTVHVSYGLGFLREMLFGHRPLVPVEPKKSA